MEKILRHPASRGCPNKGARRQTLAACIVCYTNGRMKTNIPGHYGYHPPRKPEKPFEEFIMKRPESKTAGGKLGTIPAVDEQWVKKYPTILAYLCDETYDDGGAREVSALSISVREGDFLLALNDKDLKQSVYTQAHSLTDGLKLMEEALREGKCQWRPWKSGKRK